MRAHRVILLLCLLWPAPVRAQPAPTIVSTLQTTNTGATSLQVGCAVGSSTCTGGIVAGTVLANALGAEAGYVEIQSNVPASTTYRLYNNSGTLMWNGITLATGSSVSGTTGTIALFTASNAIGNSIMTQSGTTITVANTLSATTLAGTLSTANQPNVTGLGTITSGVWSASATKIGLGSGGTAADLSGTGGTSQFLRQNAIGAAVSVVRPAVADLSDAANVFLLNANNTVSATGTQVFGGGGTGADSSITINGANATGEGPLVIFRKNASGIGNVGSVSAIIGSGTSSDLGMIASVGGIQFFTNGSGSPKWGINSAGDFTFGASSHIYCSDGTPTLGAGWGTGQSINGDDCTMLIQTGTTAGGITNAIINFGHTWSTAPVCIPVQEYNAQPIIVSVSTTTLTYAQGSSTTQDKKLWIICHGY